MRSDASNVLSDGIRRAYLADNIELAESRLI